MNLYFRLFTFLKGARGQLALKISIGLFMMSTYVGQAFATAATMRRVFGGGSVDEIFPLLLVIAVLIVIRTFLFRIDEIYGKKIACHIKNRLRERLLMRLMDLGPGYQENYRSGNLQSVLIDGVESLEPFLTGYIPQLLVSLIGSGAVVIYIWTLDPIVGWITAGGLLIAVGAPQIGSNFFKRIILEYWQSYAKLNAQYIDGLQGMTTLKVFQASKIKGQELEAEAKDVYRRSMKSLGASLLDSAIVKWGAAAGAAFATAVGALRVTTGNLPPQHLFVILFLTVECFRPLNDLNRLWHQSFLGFAAARGIFNLLDEPLIVEERNDSTSIAIEASLPELTFKEVSFAYSGGKRPAVKNVSFHIKSGEKVAFVGKSGSGKSTIVQLIMRFFDPQSGSILLNGEDIREYSFEDLRDKIAVVFQDTYLFYGTVSENLRVANPKATQEELERAAQLAGAHEFIAELPQGYDTVIGERGIRLSGGQKQRLSIARAFLKDAPLLILDEATSNVDALSEEKIQHALEHLMKNKTTILIAHRLSTIQSADRIFVMDDQELKEEGNHQELLFKKGFYAQLIKAQHE
ncbi:ABC-type multidrug transport system, ATPase and permease component [Anaerovirgula multivorans]|uniref:ABC-type multidrug transport system, ATPase and permease component n=1 Tax=Anaerovirgula multivorans TaxID=312168 RepID=A0A239IJD1_9FIRM|nr:ABC transporter ATP-binding protein [Anaerovirgula multivorans]SNS93866.1 ABC-type multidrug transport system, ATPase and permease component [Anaerovirgula multivorans]